MRSIDVISTAAETAARRAHARTNNHIEGTPEALCAFDSAPELARLDLLEQTTETVTDALPAIGALIRASLDDDAAWARIAHLFDISDAEGVLHGLPHAA